MFMLEVRLNPKFHYVLPEPPKPKKSINIAPKRASLETRTLSLPNFNGLGIHSLAVIDGRIVEKAFFPTHKSLPLDVLQLVPGTATVKKVDGECRECFGLATDIRRAYRLFPCKYGKDFGKSRHYQECRAYWGECGM